MEIINPTSSSYLPHPYSSYTQLHWRTVVKMEGTNSQIPIEPRIQADIDKCLADFPEFEELDEWHREIVAGERGWGWEDGESEGASGRPHSPLQGVNDDIDVAGEWEDGQSSKVLESPQPPRQEPNNVADTHPTGSLVPGFLHPTPGDINVDAKVAAEAMDRASKFDASTLLPALSDHELGKRLVPDLKADSERGVLGAVDGDVDEDVQVGRSLTANTGNQDTQYMFGDTAGMVTPTIQKPSPVRPEAMPLWLRGEDGTWQQREELPAGNLLGTPKVKQAFQVAKTDGAQWDAGLKSTVPDWLAAASFPSPPVSEAPNPLSQLVGHDNLQQHQHQQQPGNVRYDRAQLPSGGYVPSDPTTPATTPGTAPHSTLQHARGKPSDGQSLSALNGDQFHPITPVPCQLDPNLYIWQHFDESLGWTALDECKRQLLLSIQELSTIDRRNALFNILQEENAWPIRFNSLENLAVPVPAPESFKGKRWEEHDVRAAITMYKFGLPWTAVAWYFFPGRTAKSCANLLQRGNKRKRRAEEATRLNEEVKLARATGVFGHGHQEPGVAGNGNDGDVGGVVATPMAEPHTQESPIMPSGLDAGNNFYPTIGDYEEHHSLETILMNQLLEAQKGVSPEKEPCILG